MDSMEYTEENPTISHKTAIVFVKQHPAEASHEEDKALFYEAMGVHDYYNTDEVFGWLGY